MTTIAIRQLPIAALSRNLSPRLSASALPRNGRGERDAAAVIR